MTNASDRQKPYRLHRCFSVLLRTIHISAMAIVLGGVFLGVGYESINLAIWMTLLSGGLMLLMDILKSPRILVQGSGMAVAIKGLLLAIGFFFLPDQRFGWYLAATIVASIGSHAPGHIRHYDIIKRCFGNNH